MAAHLVRMAWGFRPSFLAACSSFTADSGGGSRCQAAAGGHEERTRGCMRLVGVWVEASSWLHLASEEGPRQHRNHADQRLRVGRHAFERASGWRLHCEFWARGQPRRSRNRIDRHLGMGRHLARTDWGSWLKFPGGRAADRKVCEAARKVQRGDTRLLHPQSLWKVRRAAAVLRSEKAPRQHRNRHDQRPQMGRRAYECASGWRPQCAFWGKVQLRRSRNCIDQRPKMRRHLQKRVVVSVPATSLRVLGKD